MIITTLFAVSGVALLGCPFVATFRGETRFVNCTLAGLRLDNATCHEQADLSYSTLVAEGRARDTEFLGSLRCAHLRLGSHVKWRVEVRGPADFQDAVLDWGASLAHSHFRDDTTFDNAYLRSGDPTHEATSFEGVVFEQDLHFRVADGIPPGFVCGMRVRTGSHVRLPAELEMAPHSANWSQIRYRSQVGV